MNKICFALFFLLFFIYGGIAMAADSKLADFMKKVTWFGQSAIRISADKVVYIDPYQIKNKDNADIILITHDHMDHFDTGSIAKLTNAGTIVIGPKVCMDQLKCKTLVFEPGMKTNIGGITIEGVPAYNIVKKNYHPKDKKYLGYVLTIGGVKIYHAGDTERIPEMKNISCDIVFLPLGQTYTMGSVEEASQAALDVKARIVVPIHYGMYEGSPKDADKLKELLKNKTEVMILKQQ